MPWYVMFFGVKLNYIMILEKFCDNSTLLMVLFMICGQSQKLQFFIERHQNHLNISEKRESVGQILDQYNLLL